MNKMSTRRDTNVSQVIGQVWKNKKLLLGLIGKIEGRIPLEGNIIVNPGDENYEPFYTNDFTSGLGDFTFNSQPWTIDNTQGSGGVSAQSDIVGPASEKISSMSYTFVSPHDGVKCSFDLRQFQCEPDFDFLTIYVDGVETWSNPSLDDPNFLPFDFNILGKGEHTITFTYKSDWNTEGALNKVNIDNISLSKIDTLTLNLPLVLNEGFGLVEGFTFGSAELIGDTTINGFYVGVPYAESLFFTKGKPSNPTGRYNVAIGDRAGIALTAGASNVLMGARVFSSLSTGSNNIALGYQAGGSTNASNSVYIGYQAYGIASAVNSIAIGYQSRSTKSNQVVLGNSSTTEVLTEGDLELNAIGSGVIIKSPDGTRYRITVANGGTLSATAV